MAPQYNILHTVRSLRLDGVTKVVLRTVAHRQAREFRHHVCSIRGEDALADECRSAGVEPTFIGYDGAASAPRTVARLVRLMRRLAIDVVHANRTLDLALAGAAAAVCGIPVVSTLHWMGRIADHPEDDNPRSLRRRAEMMSPVVLNRALADRIIAVSGAVHESFASLPGFPRNRMSIVYPGYEAGSAPTPAARAQARAALGIASDRPLLLNVGRLQPVKGQLHLIPMMRHVVSRMPDTLLLIAGEGELRGPLTTAIANAGLQDAVRLLGARDDVDGLLAAADALVMSSESEAAPLPLFEAMRAARPVVATDVGGVPEIVRTGITGFVVPRSDPRAMAGAAVALLESPERARAMGAAGRIALLERFDIAHAVRAVESIYRCVLAEQPPRASTLTAASRTDTRGVERRSST